MKKKEKLDIDYDPEKDDLPRNVTVWIIILAIVGALYLSQIFV
jgi:hypothetical protein